MVSLIPADEQLALAADEAANEHDDSLDLLFMCCHPSLTPASAIALTLRAVGGLTTPRSPSAFLVPEATMAQRISRAKQTIKDSGAAFGPPSPEERAARLEAVLQVLYLIFNEGYAASSGSEVLRVDLSNEAIRLTRMLHRLAARRRRGRGPARADAAHRRAARGADRAFGGAHPARRAGPLALGPERDRRGRGADLRRPAPRRGRARTSCRRRSRRCTTRRRARRRRTGRRSSASTRCSCACPTTRWSRSTTRSRSRWCTDRRAGLERLDTLASDPRLEGHHRLDAVRAHLLERAGDHAAAIALYRRAAERTTSVAERNYLLIHAARLAEGRPA